MTKIAIVGGGISGLATLHFLKKRFGDKFNVALYERNAYTGGNILSQHEDGFCFECGPNGFLNNQSTVFELIDDLGLNDQLIKANANSSRRYIQIDNKLHAFPMDPASFIQTPLLNWGSKCRLISGLLKSKISMDQSIYDYTNARFGQMATERLIDPFVSGIFAGDVKRLHMASTLGVMFKKKKKVGGKLAMHSFKDGMGSLIKALYLKYQDNIRLGQAASLMDTQEADHIILTCPAYAAAIICQDINTELAAQLDKIVYAPIAVVGLGFNQEAFKTKPDGFGFLIPSNQNKEILGVLIESNVLESRASQGKVFIRIMIGGRHHPHIVNDQAEQLINRALKELDLIYGLKEKSIKQWTRMWPMAIPQYELGYPEIAANISRALAQTPKLTLSGNYLGGVSMNDCINNAKSIANSI